MLMADVLSVSLIVIGALLAHAGLWLLCRGLWPAHVTRAASRIEAGLVVTMLTGVVPFAASLVTIALLSNVAGSLGKALSVLIASSVLLFAHAGLAGAVSLVGARLADDLPLPRERGAPTGEWSAMRRGSIALCLAYAFPILGWFVILPLSIILGVGASLLAVARTGATREVMA